jgi:peptide/nickel transport system permease protein
MTTSPLPQRVEALGDLSEAKGLAANYRSRSQGRLFWSRFRRHRLALGGTLVLMLLLALAALAPQVARHDPNRVDLLSVNAPPSAEHWLGTDRTGRDVFARVLYGGRISLSVGLVAVSISGIIGTVLGAFAGYFGGPVDQVIMRVTDIVMCFPTLIIIITLVSFVGPSIYNIMIAVGIFSWPALCRLVRAEFLRLRAMDYVLAAHCLGVRPHRIVFRHVLPNATGPIIVNLTFGVAGAILQETALSFLGLGVQQPTPSWGNMVQVATSFAAMEGTPWIWIPPAAMICIAVLAINYVGEGLRDALDPRMVLQ